MTDMRKTLGRIFVACSLVVFGIQHLIYGGFVATLVPAFMPGRLFWAYFLGLAFFAAATRFLSTTFAATAPLLLGGTFFFILRVLNLPSIIGYLTQWNA